jgi:hypothetical protein
MHSGRSLRRPGCGVPGVSGALQDGQSRVFREARIACGEFAQQKNGSTVGADAPRVAAVRAKPDSRSRRCEIFRVVHVSRVSHRPHPGRTNRPGRRLAEKEGRDRLTAAVIKYSVHGLFTIVNKRSAFEKHRSQASSISFGIFALAAFAFFPFCALPTAAQDNPPAASQPPADAQTPSTGDQLTAVPNRPTFSTTAEAVQRGVFEIEYGFEAGDGHQNINGLLKFGLFKNLELRFGNNPIERDSGVAGRGDSFAGFKYRLFEEKGKRPTVSLLYAALIPTATASLGIGALGHSAEVLVSQDFGKHHFDFNWGPQWLGRPGATGFDRNYFTALAYSHPAGGKWGITGEIAGYSRANAATPATMTIMGAATYNVKSRLVLDGGAYIGAYGNLPTITFFSGVTYSVGDLYRELRERKAGQGRQSRP